MKKSAFSGIGRALAAALTVGLAASSFPAPAMAQSVTVVVGGQPLYLNPGPIERAGRVFVPLRGIFERLGASVVYSSGTINATKGQTTVSLHIGSPQATVNGNPQTIDVAPFIVGATTYVPLRFVAQSLGADVGYDSSSRVVSVRVLHPGPPIHQQVPPPARPYTPPYAPPAGAVQLRGQQPEPGVRISDRFATISADFTRRVSPRSVRVWLDGNDISSRAGISAGSFSYKPPAPLGYGSHTVRVAGNDVNGSGFSRSWSFTVNQKVPSRIHLTISAPDPNAPVGQTFTVQGNTVANGRVRVTAGGRPSGTGQFSGSTVAGALGNFRISVTLSPALLGQQSVTVRITATDPATSASTETTLQLRLNR